MFWTGGVARCGRRRDRGGSGGQLHGTHRWRRGHVVVVAIRDHRDGVGPWCEDKRFREHLFPRLRGDDSHRVDPPFPASLRSGSPPSGLCVDRRRIERPEDLANSSTLIGEGDLDLDVRLRDGGAVGRSHKGHQRWERVAGGCGREEGLTVWLGKALAAGL